MLSLVLVFIAALPASAQQVTSINCNYTADITIDNSETSTRRPNCFQKRFQFSAYAGQEVRVRISTSIVGNILNGYIYLVDDSNGTVIGQDGDSTGSQAQITAVCPTSGTYTIEATTYDPNTTTSYWLDLTCRPFPPQNVVATGGSGKIDLTWQAPALSTASVDRYIIYRSPGGCPYPDTTGFTAIQTLQPGNYSFSDFAVVPGVQYTYKVRTNLVAWESVDSTTSSATAQSAPGPPISCGLTTSATLCTPPVPPFTEPKIDRYSFSGQAGQKIRVTVQSSAFSSLAWVFAPGDTAGDSGYSDPARSSHPSRHAETPLGSGTNQFEMTLPQTGTYSIQVSASAIAAYNSRVDGPYTIHVECADPIAAPTITATAGDGQVAISGNSVAGASTYTLFRSLTSGGPYDPIAGATRVSSLNYNDTAVQNGTTYYYVAKAYNDGVPLQNESPYSAEASATPQIAKPQAPLNLAATAGNAKVTLVWSDSSNRPDRVDGYKIYRSETQGSGYAPVGTAAQGALTYTDTQVVNLTRYYYRVTAYNTVGESDYSNEADAMPDVPPAAPTGLSARAGDRKVHLKWSASADAASYQLLRSTVQGTGYTLAKSGITATTETDAPLSAGTRYYYVVRAVKAVSGVASDNSNEASAVPYAVLPIQCGQSPLGTLANTDALATDRPATTYADYYSFQAQAGQEVVLTLTSPDFDTYVYLIDAEGRVLISNNNAPGTTNSSLRYTFPATGTYTIEVTSAAKNTLGAYQLSLCCTLDSLTPAIGPGSSFPLAPTGVVGPDSGAGWQIVSVVTGATIATSAAPGESPLHRWDVEIATIEDASYLRVSVPSGFTGGGGLYEVRYVSGSGGEVTPQPSPENITPSSDGSTTTSTSPGSAVSARFHVPCESPLLPHTGQGIGLTGRYFDEIDFTNLKTTRVDAVLDFNWDSIIPPGTALTVDDQGNFYYGVRWTGKVQPRYSEPYVFQVNRDDNVIVWLDGVKIVDATEGHTDSTPWLKPYRSQPLMLVAGQKYDIRVQYLQATAWARMHLQWESPSQPLQIIPQTQLYPEDPSTDKFRLEAKSTGGNAAAEPHLVRVTPSTFSPGDSTPSGDVATVELFPLGDFTGNVALDLPSLPEGVSNVIFDPSGLAPGAPTSSLSFDVSKAKRPGLEPLVIRGVGDGVTQTAGLTLVVHRYQGGPRPQVRRGEAKEFPEELNGAPIAPTRPGIWEIVAPWDNTVIASGEVGVPTKLDQWGVTLDKHRIFRVYASPSAWVTNGYQVRWQSLKSDNTPDIAAYAEFDVLFKWKTEPGAAPETLVCNQTLASASLLAAGDHDSWFAGAQFKADHYQIDLVAGTTVTLSMNSTDVDTHLYLVDPSGKLIERSDNTGTTGSTDSQIVFNVTKGGTYLIEASTSPAPTSLNPARTGNYSLSVSCAETPVGENTPPTVSMTAPESGAVIPQGQSIALAAEAMDNGGAVAGVVFNVTGPSGSHTFTAVSAGSNRYTYDWTGTIAAGTYTVTATATDNGIPALTTTSAPITFTVSSELPVRVDSGKVSGGPFTTAAGLVFEQDAYTVTGVDWQTNVAPVAISEADRLLYQSIRVSADGQNQFRYWLPAIEGNDYTLRLHFFDPTSTAAGQRQFNVDVTGQGVVLSGYDAFQRSGSTSQEKKTRVEEVSVKGNASNQVEVVFIDLVGKAIVSAIELIPAGAAPGLILCGQSVTGELTTTDSPSWGHSTNANEHYSDRFRLRATEGEVVSIVVHAAGETTNGSFSGFNPQLFVLNADGTEVLAENDDIGQNPGPGLSAWDSRIVFVAPETGTYTIEVTSAQSNTFGAGGYSLTVDCVPLSSFAPPAPSDLRGAAYVKDKLPGSTSPANPNALDAVALSYLHAGAGLSGFEIERALVTNNVPGEFVKVGEFDASVLNPPPHYQLALYLVDVDRQGRTARVEVFDAATSALLDKRDVTEYQEGKYLVWNVRGQVHVRVTHTSSKINVLASGLFFDPVLPGTPLPGGAGANAAAFVRTDTLTQGTWKGGVYGTDGYRLLGYENPPVAIKDPSYATVSITGSGLSQFTFADSTSDVRALQKPDPATDRIASALITTTSFDIAITPTASGGGGTFTASRYGFRDENATVLPERIYEYRVRAFNASFAAAGRLYSDYSPSARVHTYSVPPVVSIQKPTENFVAAQGNSIAVKLAASASDGANVASVQVFANGMLLGPATLDTDSKTQFTYPLTGLQAGSYLLRARVTDSHGLFSDSAPVGITVTATGTAQAGPPVIFPAGGSFSGPPVITISSAAATPESTIYYTTDDSNPATSPTAKKYVGPFVVPVAAGENTVQVVVRAIAYKSEMDPSNPAAVVFMVTPPAQQQGAPAPGGLTMVSATTNLPGGLTDVLGPTLISGTVNGSHWTLAYRLIDGTAANVVASLDAYWTQLGSGIGPLSGSQPLAEFDPTMLENGLYEVRLRVFNLTGQYADSFRTVLVKGNQKVGPFTLPLVDLSIPAPAFPIQVTRTYDSRDKQFGDFGTGWKMGISGVRVQKSVDNLGAHWKQVQGLGGQFFLTETKPHYITITTPDGGVYAFYMKVEPATNPWSYTADLVEGYVTFEPLLGTPIETRLETLDPYEDDYIVIDGAGTSDVDELALYPSETAAGFWNPTYLWMRTREGTEYTINAEKGVVETIMDRLGNKLEYTYQQIDGKYVVTKVEVFGPNESAARRALSITRDTLGRVDYIEYPAGKVINYGYGAGETSPTLMSFTDRENATTTYQYDFAFNLTRINAPEVTQGAGEPTLHPYTLNHYDPQGRLVSTEDSAHNVATFSHNVAARRSVVTDRMGNSSLMAYDPYGNVTMTAGYLATEGPNNTIATKTIKSEAGYGYQDSNPEARKNHPDKKLWEKDALGNTTYFGYSGKGELTDVFEARKHPENPNVPLQSRYVYHDNTQSGNNYGQVVRVERVDPSGTVLSDGTPKMVTVSLNQYDGRGNLVKTTDANGKSTFYVDPNNPSDPATGYRSDGQPQMVMDANGVVTKYDYYESGVNVGALAQVVQTFKSTNGPVDYSTTTYTYDAEGNKKTQSVTRTKYDALTAQPAGTETLLTTFEYDDNGRLKRTISPELSATPQDSKAETIYNALGKVQTRKDASGKETHYVYDNLGQLVKTKHPDGTFTTSGYNANGQVTQSADKAGRTSETFYDTLGRAVKTVSKDADGQNPATTTTEYDDNGRVTKTWDAKANLPGANPVRPTSETVYDEVGNVKIVRDASGAETTYTYDENNRQKTVTTPKGTTHYTYDNAGRVTRVDLPDNFSGPVGGPFGGSSPARVETIYDNLGRRKEEKVRFQDSGSGIDAENWRVTRFDYDDLGRLKKVTQVHPTEAAKNLVTEYGYDEVGNKIWQQDAMHGATVTNPDASTRVRQGITRFEYDKNGRMVKRVLPMKRPDDSAMAETFAYRADGRLNSKTDFRGKTTTFTYDDDVTPVPPTATGRLVSRNPDTRLNEPGISYEYYTEGHRVGLKKSATYGNGRTEYDYDARGRLSEVKLFIDNQEDLRRRISYTYDLQGNRNSVTTIVNGTAFTTGYEYDDLDRLWKVHHPSNGGTTQYQYDGVGSLEWVYRPNGVNTHYVYNERSHLTKIGHWQGNPTMGGTLLRQFDYTPDYSGKRTQVTETLADSSTRTSSYTYDFAGRLEKEVVSASNATTTTQFEYDRVGNRRTQTLTPAGQTIGQVTSYFYDDNDRLLQTVEPGNVVTAYGYDASGNSTHINGIETNFYSFENRLMQMGPSSGARTLYDYDAEGNRIGVERLSAGQLDGQGAVSAYLVDTNLPYAEVVEEYDNQGHLAHYDFGLDRVRMDRRVDVANGPSYYAPRFYLFDGLGSTAALTDGNGNVSESWVYEAFGKPTQTFGQSSNVDNLFLFNGQQWDDTEELYFLRARYYGPGNGRFLGQDPWEGIESEPMSLHRYLYAYNDPLNLVDPSGNAPENGGYNPDAQYAHIERAIQSAYIKEVRGGFSDNLGLGVPNNLADQQYYAAGRGWVGSGNEPIVEYATHYYVPDIFDKHSFEFNEIKSADKPKDKPGYDGLADGARQIALYYAAFSPPNKRAPEGFVPNIVWVPAEQPLVVRGARYWVYNAAGVLLYTRDQSKARSARQFVHVPVDLTLPISEMIPWQIGRARWVQAVSRIRGLAIGGVSADKGRTQGAWALATLIGLFGVF